MDMDNDVDGWFVVDEYKKSGILGRHGRTKLVALAVNIYKDMEHR